MIIVSFYCIIVSRLGLSGNSIISVMKKTPVGKQWPTGFSDRKISRIVTASKRGMVTDHVIDNMLRIETVDGKFNSVRDSFFAKIVYLV